MLQYKSSYVVLFNKVPDYSKIKIFGCLYYISNLYSPTDKFASKILKCVFLGYPFNKKGYRVKDIETKKCYFFYIFNLLNTFSHFILSSDLPVQDFMFPISPLHDLQDSPIYLLSSTETPPSKHHTDHTAADHSIVPLVNETPIVSNKLAVLTRPVRQK